MSQELKPCEEMTDAELDAELREHGIDPEKVLQHAFQKVCVLAKEQSAKLAQLEHTNAALLGALKRPLSDEEKDALEDASEIGSHRTWLVVEGILAARAPTAEAESQKENGNG